MKEIICGFWYSVKFGYKAFKETFDSFKETRKLAIEASQVRFTKPILDEKTQRTMDIIRNKSVNESEKLPRYTDPKIQEQVDSYNRKVSETIKKDLESLPPLGSVK